MLMGIVLCSFRKRHNRKTWEMEAPSVVLGDATYLLDEDRPDECLTSYGKNFS